MSAIEERKAAGSRCSRCGGTSAANMVGAECVHGDGGTLEPVYEETAETTVERLRKALEEIAATEPKTLTGPGAWCDCDVCVEMQETARRALAGPAAGMVGGEEGTT